MTTLADRFDLAWKASGLEKADVERRVSGEPGGHLSHVLAGRRVKLSHLMLTRYAETFGVKSEWLALGEGPMRAEDAHPPPDRHEIPAGPRDATAEGRWHVYAARYSNFRAVATFRHRVEGVPDAVLDSAADDLGQQKSETGPTEEETDAAIDKWLKRTANRAAKELPDGREATADDFRMPAAGAKTATAKKKGARR